MTDADHLIYRGPEPLSCPELLRRLGLNKVLNAVRCFRTPDPEARLHVLVKDNIGTDEFTTTAGSLALEKLHVPDAFCVTRLKASGIDVFGKTVMTELAGFVTTQKSELGYSQTGGFARNPYGDFPPRGSSTGSAVAVAAGLCDAALGTETRGSLMLPGLANGVVAFKPSRGLISRTGIVPLSSHFDTPGVISRTPETAAWVAQCMAGADPEDPVTQGMSVPLLTGVKPLTRPLTLAVLSPTGNPVTDAVMAKLAARLPADTLLKRIDVPAEDFSYKLITSQDIRRGMDRFLGRYASGSTPNSFEALWRFYREHPDTHPFGMDRLDDAAVMPVMTEAEVDAVAAQAVAKARNQIDAALTACRADFLATPVFVDWWAISGAPSITIPLGTESDGRPFGLMLGARFGEDAALIAAARGIFDGRRVSEG